MKRGHIILIGGAALLVIGIAVTAIWGVSFASRFISDNTIVGRTTIEPGQSVTTKTDIREVGKPLTLMVGIDRSVGQQQQQPAQSDIKLRETMTNPKDQVVSSNEFGDSIVTSVKPEETGTYAATITNLGEKAVTVAGTFGYFAIIGPDGKPDLNALFGTGQQGLGMIIEGGVMVVGGIMALIVGGIITVADSRAQGQTSTATSEGGITYRKD